MPWILTLVLAATAAAAPAPKGAAIRGRVTWSVGAVSLDASEMAVYLVDDSSSDAPQKEHARMAQKNIRFQPEMLVITKGQTVDFPNEDATKHNVFSLSALKKFDLGTYPQGESKSVTFDKDGAITIYCSVHSGMKARIFVSPSPYHAVTDPDGVFVITGVPAGSYRLRTWHSQLPALEKAVVVSPEDAQGKKELTVTLTAADAVKGSPK